MNPTFLSNTSTQDEGMAPDVLSISSSSWSSTTTPITSDSDEDLNQYEENPLWNRIVDINNARLDLEEETESWMEHQRTQQGLTPYDDTPVRQLKSVLAVPTEEDIDINALFLHLSMINEDQRLKAKRTHELVMRVTKKVCSLRPRANCSPEAEARYHAMVISALVQDALYVPTPSHYCGNCHYQAQMTQWVMQQSCSRRNRDNDPPATPDHIYRGNTDDDTEKAFQDAPNNA
ncbi:hypothetical protein BJV82DRAFT_673412 [Fennellomyces sp. T-0311]|nr:hypothetical protein BJV82DRAFT_673412 [Fennellomyces sp. T-0311]